jgi:hypothetical protein
MKKWLISELEFDKIKQLTLKTIQDESTEKSL